MKKILYIAAMLFFSVVLIYAWSEKPRFELENNMVRLHILANGNSEHEQIVKLKVRDRILSLANEKKSLPDLLEMERMANDTLKELGEDYGAKLRFEKCNISRRKYDGFILPAGKYTAVRIVLGSGNGKNWWCVLSPPLCFTNSAIGKSDELCDRFDEETNKIINADKIRIKFRVVEAASYVASKLGI